MCLCNSLEAYAFSCIFERAYFKFLLVLQVPFYKGEHITFDVVPEKLDFEVAHDSVVFKVSWLSVFFQPIISVLFVCA